MRGYTQKCFSRFTYVLFKKNLLITNCLTSGGCMFLGDIIQQEFEYQEKIIAKRYDWERAGRMFIVGAALGPLHHYYYTYLDVWMPKVNLKTVFQKILLDQILISPFTTVLFFYGMGLLEKKSTEKIYDEVVDKFKYVYLGDCLFWPPIQFVNFFYISTQYRVLYINVATMVFNVFLSYMKHYDKH